MQINNNQGVGKLKLKRTRREKKIRKPPSGLIGLYLRFVGYPIFLFSTFNYANKIFIVLIYPLDTMPPLVNAITIYDLKTCGYMNILF